jgi:transcriptional regulator with XRE-family HTH domain
MSHTKTQSPREGDHMEQQAPQAGEELLIADADHELLSRRLREAREYLGLSQETVSEHLGVPRAAISAMETGKRKVSSLELKQLAKLYRRDYNYFLESDKELEESSESEDVSKALFRITDQLKDSDREQVLRFAQFLKQAGSPPRPTS